MRIALHNCIVFSLGLTAIALAQSMPAADSVDAADSFLGPWPPACVACLQADGAIEIDGRLDEPAWIEQAAITDSFMHPRATEPPTDATSMRMCWDETNLYIAISMWDATMEASDQGRANAAPADQWVQLFFDPNGDTHRYFELTIGPDDRKRGMTFARPPRHAGSIGADIDVSSVVFAAGIDGRRDSSAVHDQHWVIEIAVPWTIITEATRDESPRLNERWRMNAARLRVTAAEDDAKSLLTSTWSAQRSSDLHEPEYWGVVEFRDASADKAAPAVPPEYRAAWSLREYDHALRRWLEADEARSLDDLSTFDCRISPAITWSWPPRLNQSGSTYALEITSNASDVLVLRSDGRLLWRSGQ
ncbi:MAG: carbohydrate-binding family 9-like protein [Planctomycetota bacterium]